MVYAVVPIFAVIAAWLSGTLTTLTGEPLYGFPLQWKTLVVVGGCPPGPIEIVCRLARTYIVYNWSFFGLDAVSSRLPLSNSLGKEMFRIELYKTRGRAFWPLGGSSCGERWKRL